jgi:transcriptional regulator with XRE-family HTH domain
MITKHSPPAKPIRWNGHRRVAAGESLSARIFRLRIARGDSIYDLARESNVLAGTIRKLESGKPADKRVLPALAAALGVPLCQLVCGDHSCSARACVRTASSSEPQ